MNEFLKHSESEFAKLCDSVGNLQKLFLDVLSTTSEVREIMELHWGNEAQVEGESDRYRLESRINPFHLHGLKKVP